MKKLILLLLFFATMHTTVVAQEEITMLTYNIKGNSTNATKIADVAKVINYYNCDFVAIQEVHKRPNVVFHDYLADIAEATSLKPQFFPLVSNYYGVGILSKDDPISIQTRSFPFSDASKDKEDRGVLIAEFPNFYFVSTHYSLNANDRDTATAWLVKFATNSDKTVFVAGDFNAQPTYRAMVTFTNNGFKILNDPKQFTIPSNAPTSCIDMIISYSDFAEAEKYEVISSGIATTPGVKLADVTDHLPVFVNIRPVSGSVGVSSNEDISISVKQEGILIHGLKEISQISLIDISGRILDSQQADNNELISFKNAPEKGIYILTIKNGQQNLSKKILFIF